MTNNNRPPREVAKEWHPALLDDHELKFEMVRVADINIDTSYQRPLNHGRLEQMWAAFDPAELTAIVVSRRADGSLWCIDGQHRLELLGRVGKSVILADIREGLAIEQEAILFYRLNRGQTRVTTWDEFKARLRGNEPVAMRIRDIVERHGFRIGVQSEDMAIRGVSALEAAYGVGKLDKTLAIIGTVWTRDKVGRESNLILGLSTFLLTFDGTDGYDDGRVLEMLDKVSPSAIVRRAKEIQIETGRPGHKGSTIALAIRDAYNGKLTKGTHRRTQQLYGSIVTSAQARRERQRG